MLTMSESEFECVSSPKGWRSLCRWRSHRDALNAQFKARRADTSPAVLDGLAATALWVFQSIKNHFRGLFGSGSRCVGPGRPEIANLSIGCCSTLSISVRWFLRILLTVCVLTGSSTGRAQEATPEVGATDSSWHFRSHLFQGLLEEQGMTATQSLSEAFLAPAESVIVMTGQTGGIEQHQWIPLIRFVSQGGRLLLASDCTDSIRGFHIGPVTTSTVSDQYLDYPDCLRVTSFPDDHSLTQNVRELIVNRSGWLSQPTERSFRWTVVARLPSGTSPTKSAGQPLVIVGQPSGHKDGAIVLAADQSLFANNMLWHGDNAIFAIRMCEFLTEGKRNRLAFVSDGEPLPGYREQIQPPPAQSPPLPEPDLAKILRVANQAIRDVEDSNIVNETLMNRPRDLRIPSYPRTVLLLLGAAAFAFLIWKLAQQMSPRPGPPAIREMLSAHAMNVEHHGIGLELSVAAQMLARDLCRELTASDLPDDWKRELFAAPRVRAAVWKKSRKADLKLLLNLAVAGCGIHLSQRRFIRIGRQIQELRQLHRASLTTEKPIA